ncbi:hypothetical protein BH10BAC4_BH10BAC4_15220 [soil metagenome]
MNLKSIFVPVLFVFSACSSTSIVSSWKDPNASVNPEQLNKVMVVALIKSEGMRRVAEDKMATFNKAFQVSYNEFSSKEIMDNEERCRAILKDQGFDGIITLRVTGAQKERTYVPSPAATGGGYWAYHGQYYPGFYQAGYYQEDMKYVIETHVFSLKQNKLLWAGITSTVSEGAIDEQTVADVMHEVRKQMVKDKFIPAM